MLTKKVDKCLLSKLFDPLEIGNNIQLVQNSAIVGLLMLLLEVMNHFFDVLTSH